MAARVDRPVLLDNTVLTNLALVDRCELVMQLWPVTTGTTHYDIPTTGTVGILTRCVQRGYLARDQADHLLAEMIALGYRSPVTDLSALLDRQ